jgi:A/G-specific adenine glycosylase
MSKLLVSLKNLADWFNRQKRVLPWRDQPTPYRVWVSEIMLQQTQVVAVIPYFEKFIARFPTVEVLAEALVEEVLLFWAGLGYYSRARNLHRSAQLIAQNQGFPKTREEWLKMPGVGHYTAGAILSIALHQPEPILDGNIERVLSRLRRVNRELGDARFKLRLWRISEIFVRQAHLHGIDPSVLNQSLMELGATICTPRSPKCSECALKPVCRAFQFQEQERFPPKKKPKQWIAVEETRHFWMNACGQVLLTRQPKGKWREGLWDLMDEEPADLGKSLLGQVRTRHVVTRHKIHRITYVWTSNKKTFTAAEPALEHRLWVPARAPGVALGAAAKKTLAQVLEDYF